ncbi:MAG: hypothetical protein AAB809_00090, partial [Patescibacteria group bacterium]
MNLSVLFLTPVEAQEGDISNTEELIQEEETVEEESVAEELNDLVPDLSPPPTIEEESVEEVLEETPEPEREAGQPPEEEEVLSTGGVEPV